MSIALFDTHTHFDVPDFDSDREQLAYAAKAAGVEHLVLIGFVQSRFQDLIATQQFLNQLEQVPQSHLAPGLHPFYIEQHQNQHLQDLEQFLQQQHCVAVGEIGLDTFLAGSVSKAARFFCYAIGNRTASTKTCAATYS